MTPHRVLTVEQLHKSFLVHAVSGRRIVGLRDVGVTVDAGEHVALAGPSGSGKSTLLKCVHRTYLADRGRVILTQADGREIDLVTAPDHLVADLRALEMGYVSQFLRSAPRRGVLDVVTRAGVRRGLDEEAAEEAAGDVLARLGIGEELWPIYPSLLSGGEKQRVNLAAGIVAPPRLLLLDEPMSALDPAARENVLSVLAAVSAAGAAILSVFHDHDAIARLAHRVVQLRDGAIESVAAA
jgi:alpha-D-ribose 1-methylphosphonate 5-triphosphate synthase subunit PhnL